MIRVVIFGTGSSGERAWSAAEEVDGVDVIAFADNNPAKHGATVHRRPVWSAEALAASAAWDRVVVASQWHREIIAALVARGLPRARLVAFRSGDGPEQLQEIVDRAKGAAEVRVGSRRVRGRTLPRVLILSYETVNHTHGTGVLLQRYFGDFPRERLLSIAHRDSGRPWLANAAIIEGRGPTAVARARELLRDFTPDVIYATALSEADLDLLHVVSRALPRRVPVIQHFMDFIPRDEDAFLRSFRKILPLVGEVWALTEPIQRLLDRKLGCRARLVTGLLQRVPDEFRDEHRMFDSSFRSVMVGNFYNPAVIPFMGEVWARCRAELAGLGPVEWLVAPQRLQELLDAGNDPGLEFVWRGFFKGGRLQRRLASADLAILPLNQGARADSHYLRYSLPSRIAEFACLGLPVVAIASADTPLADFVRRHRLGCVISGEDVDATARQIVAFIRDRAARAEAGAAGRRLAEQDFRIECFRGWFNQAITERALGRESTVHP